LPLKVFDYGSLLNAFEGVESVWALAFVMIAPPASDDPHVFEAVEDLELITQAGTLAFDITIFPGAAGLDRTWRWPGSCRRAR
jgi:hypothetical protein